jgi:23S rRNA pseudouridine2605 synthase
MSERPRKPAGPRGRTAASPNDRPPGKRRAPDRGRSTRVRGETPDRRIREPEAEPQVAPSARRATPATAEAPKPAPTAAASAPAASAAAGASQKLQKVLAQSGLGSRREMEELIAAGKVLVNGLPATLGDRVTPDDLVKVGRRHIRFKLSARLPRVIIYHKPEGEIVSRDDPEGRTSVFDKLPVLRGSKWLAIGRLDFNTCGLLIFTTSGELANRLTHPRFEVEREYAVRVMGELTEQQGRALVNGVELPDGPAHFDILETQGGTGSNNWYRVVVREGRNRLVRRMFEHVGLTVSRLMRVRFGMINLPPRLKRGQHLELTEAQTRSVLDWLARTGAPVGDAEEEAPPAPTRSKRQRAVPAPGRTPRAPAATARSGSPRSGPSPRGDRGRKR